MQPMSRDVLTEQLELADQLLAGRATMFKPQDLPGRYGRVVRAIDHVLRATQIPAVLGGGWAVWFHGFSGRVTQDIDIAVPADRVDELLRTEAASGFEILPRRAGRWPQMMHKETGVKVDLLPEGARPGTPAKPAPTTIPHPEKMGATVGTLQYMHLPSLIELKIAAGRARDESDVVELLRANPDKADAIRRHLATVHADYVQTFERWCQRARDQQDE